MFLMVRNVMAVASLAVGLASCSAVGASTGAAAPAAATSSIANMAAVATATATAKPAPTAPIPTAQRSATPRPPTSTGLSVSQLTTTKVTLPARLGYLQQGYNELPEWTRVDVAAAPDGTAWAAWPAANGVHVTPLTAAGTRRAADTVIAGTSEVSGLVAFDNGFTLLTRVPDINKWHETAAALIGYRGGRRAFETRLTSTATNDTAPVLDGALAWNGHEYGAYFVIHGAGGFADGHFGDKLTYLSATGAILPGGWSWGCSHNEGIALTAGSNGDFPSLCGDDWRSGIFVSTGIGAPDIAPVIQREQCWAGYCGGTFPDGSGDLVKLTTGRYAVAWASRGAVKAVKNPADSSGRGWLVTPRWKTHQVAVHLMASASTPSGSTIYLTSDPATDNVNVHLAPYGRTGLLVSWESVSRASCTAGTCTGTFTGTHIEVISYAGKALYPAITIPAHISGTIAALPNGNLTWAYVAATPDYRTALGASPATTTLSIARLAI
jgi:hypothetical protein